MQRLKVRYLGIPLGLWISLVVVSVALAAWILITTNTTTGVASMGVQGGWVGGAVCEVTSGPGTIDSCTYDGGGGVDMVVSGVYPETIIETKRNFENTGPLPLFLCSVSDPGVGYVSLSPLGSSIPSPGTEYIGAIHDFSGVSEGEIINYSFTVTIAEVCP